MGSIGSLILFALPLVAMLALVVALNRPGWRGSRRGGTADDPQKDAA